MSGTARTDYRTEHDSMGEVRVPADKYWGAQTERSRNNFKIGSQKIPAEVVRAFAILKKAAAITNLECGVLTKQRPSLYRAFATRYSEEVWTINSLWSFGRPVQAPSPT